MYTYEASGRLGLKKCGIGVTFTPLHIFFATFGPGEEAWLKYRAEKGKLESVIIKKVKVIPYLYEGRGTGTIIYFDTFNAAYNEWDLITHAQAVALVTAYLQRRLLDAAQAGCLL